MKKMITYKTKNEVFTFEAVFCDALEMCSEVQKHALANNVNIEDIVSINYK